MSHGYRFQPMPTFGAATKQSITRSARIQYSNAPAAGVIRADSIFRRIKIWLHSKQTDDAVKRIDTSAPYGAWAAGWHDAAYPKGWQEGPDHL